MLSNTELSHTKLIPNQIITGEQLYTEAITLILQNARRELLIFDQDLSHGGFASLEKFNLLQHFLSANIASELTIILQEAAYFQNRCPRLLNLLEVYSHKMRVHVTNASVKHAKDCFILADRMHYIKRIHIDQPRFRFALDDRQNTEVLHNRFTELSEAIGDALTIKPLGL